MKIFASFLVIIAITSSHGNDLTLPVTVSNASEIHELSNEIRFSGALLENRGTKSHVFKVLSGGSGVSAFVLEPGGKSYIKLIRQNTIPTDAASSHKSFLTIKSKNGSSASLYGKGRLVVVISDQGDISGSGSANQWAFSAAAVSQMMPSIVVVSYGAEIIIDNPGK